MVESCNIYARNSQSKVQGLFPTTPWPCRELGWYGEISPRAAARGFNAIDKTGQAVEKGCLFEGSRCSVKARRTNWLRLLFI